MAITYYNGSFQDSSDLKIPLTDRSIFFGDGIYDAVVGRGGKIYLENEHLERFFENAKRTQIPIDKTKEEVSKLLHEAIKLSGFEGYFVYFQLSAYSEVRSHERANTESSNLLITVREHTLPKRQKELRLTVREDTRHLLCNVKTLNLFSAVLASTKARELGCDEAVFRRGGIITECAHSNIAIVKDGTLFTHPDGKYILNGITKARVLSLCSTLSIPCREVPFTVEELLSCDEVLVMSTTKLCLRATEIDKIRIKNRNSTVGKRIIDAIFDDFLESME